MIWLLVLTSNVGLKFDVEFMPFSNAHAKTLSSKEWKIKTIKASNL